MDIAGKFYSWEGRELALSDVFRMVDNLDAKDWKTDALYVDRPPSRDAATTATIKETLAAQ